MPGIHGRAAVALARSPEKSRTQVTMRPVTVRMYEREAVVEAIRRRLDDAFAGRGGTVFVVAPAGLGKTSVLRAAVAEARGRFDVREGGGDAVEAALPYGLIGQALGGGSKVCTMPTR